MRRGSIDVQHGAVRGDDAHRSEQPVRGRNLPDRVGGSGLGGRPVRRKGISTSVTDLRAGAAWASVTHA